MNATHLQLAAAVALLSGAPLAASADQLAFTAHPVALQSVNNDESFLSVPYGPRLYMDGLSVRFTNGSNVTANDVDFTVTRDGQTQIVSEKGSYAPGVSIERVLARETTSLPAANATVTISKVEFVDGSSWTPEAGRVASR
ncbi:MAG: hypothetical protein IAI49_14425 [Candidatus Eremiobacteraeota bacterium]|nr:hypothetical protein [Candidatus Eremiobacteraeota bacterium]